MVGKGKCSEQKSHFKYKVHEFVCFVRQCIAYYSHNIIINNSILEHDLITLLFELWTIRYFNDFRNCKWMVIRTILLSQNAEWIQFTNK